MKTLLSRLWKRGRPRRPDRHRLPLTLEHLEDRSLLTSGLAEMPALLTLSGGQATVPQTTLTGGVDLYEITVPVGGRLQATAHAVTGDTRLSLLGPGGELLVQSDGISPSNRDDWIDQHVLAAGSGTKYYLQVEGLTAGSIDYTLSVNFVSALPPLAPLPADGGPWNLTTADLNGDGLLDLTTANSFSSTVSVFLSRGDGTFGAPVQFATGLAPVSVIATDFNGDGRFDLATANGFDVTVSVLLGRGDGTFGAPLHSNAGFGPTSVSAADFDADGRMDLVVGTIGSGVVLLRGKGDGTFEAPLQLPAVPFPTKVVLADFNGDGRLDVATANQLSNNVSVLLRQNDGTLAAPVQYAVGTSPSDLLARDVNGDGNIDLVSANYASNNVSVLLGGGDGTFAEQVVDGECPGASALAVGDFNRDGRLDLATANRDDGTVSVLLGRADGTFNPAVRFAAGTGVKSLVAADFNGDGNLDLAVGSITPDNVTLLLGRGDGTFLPGTRLSPGSSTYGVVKGDFNEDGRLDLAAINHATKDVVVLLGRADGTFQLHGRFFLGADTLGLTTGDFNGDGHLDLAAANFNAPNILLLRGRGDGTFGDLTTVAVPLGGLAFNMVSGDFNNDGRADLVLPNFMTPTVSILRGRSDGTFDAPLSVDVGAYAGFLTVGDFNRDGKLDLATSNFLSPTFTFTGDVSILLGRGDGTFDKTSQLPVGFTAGLITTADFNKDGWSDLAVVVNFNQLLILLGHADGTFTTSTQVALGAFPLFLQAGDFDGDGRGDLVVGDPFNGRATIYRGQADGTIQWAGQTSITTRTFGGVTGDFNGDGRSDLATANMDTSDVSIRLSGPGGVLGNEMRVGIVSGPVSIVQADFNGDGLSDLATANPHRAEVSVRLGLKNGLFRDPITFTVGTTPRALTAGDFNRDGRPDLVVADYLGNQVSLLLGIGDGTFQAPVAFGVVRNPTALATGDFNGDGQLDLAVANYASNNVSLLLGQGNGTFQPATTFAVGAAPTSLVAADFNRDGRLDLAVGNYLSRAISVLLGQGNGTFQAAAPLTLAAGPAALTVGDFDGDGRLDLSAVLPLLSEICTLLGQGDGTFVVSSRITDGAAPAAIVAGDINRDGRLDLVTANYNADRVSTLLGQGDGTFVVLGWPKVGRYPLALVAGDFDSDGRLDLATANGLGEPLTVLIGLGDGEFEQTNEIYGVIHSTPLVGDLNGDGVADVAILSNNGQILFRAGLPGSPGAFAAPTVVNPDPDWTARDMALVTIGGRLQLAAIDGKSDSLSFYVYQAGGRFLRNPGPVVTGILPTRIAAGDLNADGREDLVVVTSGSDNVLIYYQGVAGFGPASYQAALGVCPTNVTLVDVDGQNGPDIVVTDRYSGDVRVLLNGGAAPFSTFLRFHAGPGLYGMTEYEGELRLFSQQATLGLVADRFDADGFTDVVVINSGSNRLALLRNSGQGGLLNAESPSSFTTGLQPIAVVTGLFNSDSFLDLAVLNEQSGDLSIFLGDGQGGFQERAATGPDGQKLRPSAGNLSTGLEVYDVNRDGRLDLLLGNEFGDLLVLLGIGDGTFQPYQRAGRTITLAVTDLNGDGREDFVLGNESLDRVAVIYSQPGQNFVRERQDGLLAPAAVTTTDLNRDGLSDLIVANSGGNNVLVYLGTGNGQFASARAFYVGTNPAGITVHDLNRDGVLDLVVANPGSNDVSVLLGQGQGATWTLTNGPRLQAGTGPVATAVADVNGDGTVDLVVSSSQSRTVSVLQGLGGGFFNDRTPMVLHTAEIPGQVFVGQFDASPGLDALVLNPEAGGLTFFSGFGAGETIATEGLNPIIGLTGDYNQDGLLDVLVGNHDNGHVQLLVGGAEGLQSFGSLADPGLMNLTGLAVGSVGGGRLEVYGVAEGSEAVVRLEFVLDLTPALGPDPGRGDAPAGAAFQPVAGSTLAFVATLLTADLDLTPSAFVEPAIEAELMTTLLVGLLPEAKSLGPDDLIGEGEDELEEVEHTAVAEGSPALNSFIIGVDQPRLESATSPVEAEGLPGEEDWLSQALRQWLESDEGRPFAPPAAGAEEGLPRAAPPGGSASDGAAPGSAWWDWSSALPRSRRDLDLAGETPPGQPPTEIAVLPSGHEGWAFPQDEEGPPGAQVLPALLLPAAFLQGLAWQERPPARTSPDRNQLDPVRRASKSEADSKASPGVEP